MRSGLWPWLLTIALPLHGCDGQDRAAGNRGNGAEGETVDCSVERWAGPDEPRRFFTCEKEESEDGPFVCDCDGRTETQSAATCDAALERACGVDPDDYEDYCTFDELGTCWPNGGANEFRCQCAGMVGPLIERPEHNCNDAILRACGEACEDETGRCEPLADTTGYECECEARTFSVEGEVVCTYALQKACHPECEHPGGGCYLLSNSRGVECRCGDDARATTVLYEEVGHDNCDSILDEVCGPTPDVPESCERRGNEASGDCSLRSDGSYSCNCMMGDDVRTGGGSPAAPSCQEQLRQYCPEAFE